MNIDRSLTRFARPPSRGADGRLRRWFAGRVQQHLNGIGAGSLLLRDGPGTQRFGAGEPLVTIRIHDRACYRRMALGGSLGAAESYIDGQWDCDDLVALMRLMLRNRGAMSGLDGLLTRLNGLIDALGHRTRRNSRRGSRRNIAAHYDLSNEFFETFLDHRMMYSSAVYESPQMTLEQASDAKLERLCLKLELGPEDHLLEVGGGWGGLAVYAAGRFGCRVTTATISPAQHRAAIERVMAAGLADRVEVLLRDYRDLEGRYDKLVSVEMVEAVGDAFVDGYFGHLERLVRPGGLVALQAITIEDRRYRQALRRVDFIKKHVFPGSFIPSVSRLVDAAARRSDLVLVNLEDLGADYATTLSAWRHRLEAARQRISQLGFDRRFQRLWRYYLCYCEAGFRERAISDVQLLFARAGYQGRPWRAALAAQNGSPPARPDPAAT